MWFATREDTGGILLIKEAKRICRLCPVRDECLGAALQRGERYGVWGGLSQYERQGLLRQEAPAAGRSGKAADAPAPAA